MGSRGCSQYGHLISHLWAAGKVHGTSRSWPWRQDRWKAVIITHHAEEMFQYLLNDAAPEGAQPTFPLLGKSAGLIPTFLAYYWRQFQPMTLLKP